MMVSIAMNSKYAQLATLHAKHALVPQFAQAVTQLLAYHIFIMDGAMPHAILVYVLLTTNAKPAMLQLFPH